MFSIFSDSECSKHVQEILKYEAIALDLVNLSIHRSKVTP